MREKRKRIAFNYDNDSHCRLSKVFIFLFSFGVIVWVR